MFSTVYQIETFIVKIGDLCVICKPWGYDWWVYAQYCFKSLSHMIFQVISTIYVIVYWSKNNIIINNNNSTTCFTMVPLRHI